MVNVRTNEARIVTPALVVLTVKLVVQGRVGGRGIGRDRV